LGKQLMIISQPITLNTSKLARIVDLEVRK